MARDAFAESNQLTDLIPSPTVRTGRVFMAGNAGRMHRSIPCFVAPTHLESRLNPFCRG
jgi:hypothetical protein